MKAKEGSCRREAANKRKLQREKTEVILDKVLK